MLTIYKDNLKLSTFKLKFLIGKTDILKPEIGLDFQISLCFGETGFQTVIAMIRQLALTVCKFELNIQICMN